MGGVRARSSRPCRVGVFRGGEKKEQKTGVQMGNKISLLLQSARHASSRMQIELYIF